MSGHAKRILLLAPTTSYRTADFLAAAARLGVEVVHASDRCHVLAEGLDEQATGTVAITFRPMEKGVEEIAALCRERPFCSIVAVDDAATLLGARAASRLGLRGNPAEAVLAARDKRVLRQRLREAGVRQPAWEVLDIREDGEQVVAAARRVGLPCVLKPVMLSASQGVIRADTSHEVRAAHARIRALLSRPEMIGKHGAAARALLVESFAPGAEVAVEGLLDEDRLRVLAIFDKPDPLDGPFFEETLYVTPSRLPDEAISALRQTTRDAARALGLVHGPVHAELRLDPRGGPPTVIEVAARSIGGLCGRTLRFATGWSLEDIILLHAIGAPLDDEMVERERCAAGVMMLPIPGQGVLREVSGVAEAQAVAGIVEVVITARPGDELVPLPEGGAYLGFVFARADTKEQVEAALRHAQRRLGFHIARTLSTL